MSNMIFKNARTDRFLNALSTQLVPVELSEGSSLEFLNLPPVISTNIAGPGSRIFTDRQGNELLFPRWKFSTVVRPTNATNANTIATFRSLLQEYITNHTWYHYYNCNLKIPDHRSKVEAKDLNRTISSYDVYTRFNYISKKYADQSLKFEEGQLPSAWDNYSRADFMRGGGSLFGPPSQIPYQKTVIIPGPMSVRDLPFYNLISISNNTTNDFSDKLKNIGIAGNFLRGYLDSSFQSIGDFIIQKEGNNAQAAKLPYYDVMNWIHQGYTGEDADKIFQPDYFGRAPLNLANNQTLLEFYQTLFAGAVTDFASKTLSYYDIMHSKEVYWEDFAYQIKKYENLNNLPIGNPIHTFISPTTTDKTLIIDSQIKYGRAYNYVGEGVYMMVGTAYKYNWRGDVWDDQIGPMAKVEIEYEPSMVLVPLPIFTEPIVAIQPPSIYPKVSFVTKKNSSKEIFLHFSPTKGQRFAKFSVITEADKEQLELMEINRPSVNPQDEFRFMTIPESGLYEIFKMDTAPKALADFAKFKLNEIRMPNNTPDAIYKDYVTPNKKYYYLFRKVNTHELVSNPTAIYEVELIVDADDSKLVVNEYKIPKKPISQDFKTFQSLFQIKPAIEHTLFDNTQQELYGRTSLANSLDYLTLGTAGHPVWSRKFKFRIRSTTSGKIVDYNITFKLSKDKTEEDF